MSPLPIGNVRFADQLFGCFRTLPDQGKIEVPIVRRGRRGNTFHIDQGVLRSRNVGIFTRTISDLFEAIPVFHRGKVSLGNWAAFHLPVGKLFLMGAGGESIVLDRDEKAGEIRVRLEISGMFSKTAMEVAIRSRRSGRPNIQVTSYEVNFEGPAILLGLLFFLRLPETTALKSLAEAVFTRLNVREVPEFGLSSSVGEFQAGAISQGGLMVVGYGVNEEASNERRSETVDVSFHPPVGTVTPAPAALINFWKLAARIENSYPVNGEESAVRSALQRYQKRLDALFD